MEEMMTVDLKECPFCGASTYALRDDYFDIQEVQREHWTIRCEHKKGCIFANIMDHYIMGGNTLDEVRDRWNMRPEESAENGEQ